MDVTERGVLAGGVIGRTIAAIAPLDETALVPPLEEAMQCMLMGEFTLDAAAVMIDGMLRLGAVMPEDPQYLDLLRLLKP